MRLALVRQLLARISPMAWLAIGSLVLLPWWVAYFYRILGLFGVVGCALPFER